jgi:SAM-dependent methyltransferase
MSSTSPSDLERALLEQERSWESRPLVRSLYLEWFDAIRARLADVPGPTVELGSGIARFRDVVPDAVLTDVEPTRWTQHVADAEQLLWEDGTVGNLVLVDVFHHLPRPARFLDEAARVLEPGGRVLILDPYCSPLSTIAYKRFHHERTDLDAAPFDEDPAVAAAPLESNQARATLVFFRHVHEFRRRWPTLDVIERQRLALVRYPLSGGFTGTPLLPSRLLPLATVAERALAPLTRLLAFRCLVVLERAPKGLSPVV